MSRERKDTTMHGPPAVRVCLSDEERLGLYRLVHAHTTAQQVALRARIVLAAADGTPNEQIAHTLGVSVPTVRSWRGRWVRRQAVALADWPLVERLRDGPRPGRPARITAEQVCQIQAVACERPQDGPAGGRPISQWTARELADEVVQRGILPQLSPRHAGRLLKRVHIGSQQAVAGDCLLSRAGS
jgi:putative transposase